MNVFSWRAIQLSWGVFLYFLESSIQQDVEKVYPDDVDWVWCLISD